MKRPLLALILVAATLLSGCTSPQATPWFGGPIHLHEYAIEPEASVWAQGRVVLEVQNQGEYSHTLVISKHDGTVVAASAVIGPGKASQLVVDLEPGTYELTCRIVVETQDGQIIDHFEHGMHTKITVQG